jgi:hypothetical protein
VNIAVAAAAGPALRCGTCRTAAGRPKEGAVKILMLVLTVIFLVLILRMAFKRE